MKQWLQGNYVKVSAEPLAEVKNTVRKVAKFGLSVKEGETWLKQR